MNWQPNESLRWFMVTGSINFGWLLLAAGVWRGRWSRPCNGVRPEAM